MMSIKVGLNFVSFFSRGVLGGGVECVEGWVECVEGVEWSVWRVGGVCIRGWSGVCGGWVECVEGGGWSGWRVGGAGAVTQFRAYPQKELNTRMYCRMAIRPEKSLYIHSE